MTHCNVSAIISNCNPHDVSLKQRFGKFVNDIFKHGLLVFKAIVTVAQNNPFSFYGSNYVEIYAMYNSDLVECNISNIIYKKGKCQTQTV